MATDTDTGNIMIGSIDAGGYLSIRRPRFMTYGERSVDDNGESLTGKSINTVESPTCSCISGGAKICGDHCPFFQVEDTLDYEQKNNYRALYNVEVTLCKRTIKFDELYDYRIIDPDAYDGPWRTL